MAARHAVHLVWIRAAESTAAQWFGWHINARRRYEAPSTLVTCNNADEYRALVAQATREGRLLVAKFFTEECWVRERCVGGQLVEGPCAATPLD